jgi:tetrahydromethanopterin S-methyltransferase subunit B
MAEGPSKIRQGRPVAIPMEVEVAVDDQHDPDHARHDHDYDYDHDSDRDRYHEYDRDQGRGSGGAFASPSGEGRSFSPTEEWMILADRRMERLEAKIDRMTEAVDQFNGQLHTLLTDMPTRKGINLYLVGGLVGGLAVGLAIMGITIGGLVSGLTSLKSEPAQLSAPQSQAPIIIQMPPGAMSSGSLATPLPPLPLPAPSAGSGGH